MKMIVTDLDRTLLRDDKTVSGCTLDMFRCLRAQGMKIVIATGRPKRLTSQYVNVLDPDVLIVHNGGIVFIGDRQHSSFSICVNEAAQILQTAAAQFPAMTISAEINDALYANFTIPDPSWQNTLSDFTDLPNLPVDKLIFGIKSMADIEKIKALLPPHMHAILTHDELLMVMNKQDCKFLAVKEVAAYFRIPISDVVAFGDDHNDVEMLKNCGIGVACC